MSIDIEKLRESIKMAFAQAKYFKHLKDGEDRNGPSKEWLKNYDDSQFREYYEELEAQTIHILAQGNRKLMCIYIRLPQKEGEDHPPKIEIQTSKYVEWEK